MQLEYDFNLDIDEKMLLLETQKMTDYLPRLIIGLPYEFTPKNQSILQINLLDLKLGVLNINTVIRSQVTIQVIIQYIEYLKNVIKNRPLSNRIRYFDNQ